MNISFKDRVALVTGASRGIGQATAIALAEAGADVAVNYRADAEGAQSTVDRIQAMGRRAKAYRAAVDSYEQCREMMDAIIRDFGSIAVLVSNAGLPSKGEPVAQADLSTLERVMKVNAFAPLYLSQLAIPHLRKQPRGDIVIVSSVATKNLRPFTAAYAMAKSAAEAFAKVLSKEEREHGIRCNVVAPGLTDTAMGRGAAAKLFGAQDIRDLDSSQPFGHVCRPEEVAQVIVYLASDANSYVSGQTIYVDGGG
jgi:NAD(P)-dependent dehydrogenase (short-subunit alcohol dehydrogenase family)